MVRAALMSAGAMSFLAVLTAGTGSGDAVPPAPVHASVALAPIPLPAPAQAVNTAALKTGEAAPAAATTDPAAPDPLLIRAEILLARAHFSAGAVTGLDRPSLQAALSAWQSARGLTPTGTLNLASWLLLSADAAPVLRAYTLTRADMTGPFGRAPAYADSLEGLAEKFHMSRATLSALNPGADLTQAGTVIAVADTGPAALGAVVTRVEVDKGLKVVRAYEASGRLVALYPTTVGSPDTPSPSGVVRVLSVTPRPYYVHLRSRVSFGGGRSYNIAPGPNNPVGLVWIELSRATYGIHGTPDPEKIGGEAASHGCVRLTNWDAQQLGAAVRPGTEVRFIEAGSAS